MKNIFTLSFFASLIFMQNASAQFQFISPMPGSTNLTIEHNIIIREGSLLDQSSLNKNLFVIRGSKSGVHDFKMILCNDGKTLNLNPTYPFTYDEDVAVTIGKGLVTAEGKTVDGYSFSFKTHREWTKEEQENMKNLPAILLNEDLKKWGDLPADNSGDNDSREITGMFTITNNTNPTDGDLFFDTWSGYFLASTFDGINVVTNLGDSVFEKSLAAGSTDLQMGKTGYFSTFRSDLTRYDVMDSNFIVVKNYYAANGYSADVHEFQMIANGNAFMIADETQIVDMTVYNPNYSPNATVQGTVIQEFDPDKNVIFEWRSFDHVAIIESEHVNLGFSYIDYLHTNSIDLDTDGNIIVSHRHLDQITKIDVNTGDFIWRLGGINNQFTFINDDAHFSYQHDCRRIANGHITLFDDGNYHIPAKSFAKEYQLDEVNMTATLVWSYDHPDVNNHVVYDFAMGSVQRLSNGNTLIGWGWRSNTDLPSITEVDSSGNILWELKLASSKNIISYRAHRYEWQPCARPTPKTMKIKDLTDHSVRLKWSPVANPTEQYEVEFKKHTDSTWKHKRTIPTKQYVKLNGLTPDTKYDWRVQSWCDTVAGTVSNYTAIKKFVTLALKPAALNRTSPVEIQLYPNPAHDAITIESTGNISQVRVMNLLGQQVKKIILGNEDSNQSVQLSLANLPRGNYFVEITTDQNKEVRKLVVE
ncbi:MAG TPA: arylsulfotransferase family protein [Chitinophagales bacterium]|nr:arylsulfotransferase family protein [Chitinophagales bacterium]